MLDTKARNAVAASLIVVCLWAVLHGFLAASDISSVFHGYLPGPDEYMRLVRVAELYDGGPWYDATIDRSNAPYGDTLHWTRPLDLLIYGGTAVLSPFLSARDALFAACAALPPVIGLLACFAVAWAAYPLIGRDRAILAAFLLLIQPAVLAYTVAGRADHHSLLFVLAALVIGGTIRTLAGRPTTGTAVLAGAAYGVAIWTSIEMTLLVALCQAVAILSWVRFPQAGARTQLVAGAAFVATMVLALVLERPPHDIMTVELDRISLPYAVIAVLMVAVWAIAFALERRLSQPLDPRRRLVAMAFASAGAAAILLALFPDLAAGPLAHADPRLDDLWHQRVVENHSLLPTTLNRTGEFIFYLATVVLTIPYAIVKGWRGRNDIRCMCWFLLAALCVTYFLLALVRFRLAPFAEIACVPVLADMIAQTIAWSERRFNATRRVLVNCAASFTLTCGTMLAGAYLMTLTAQASDGRPNPRCKLSTIAPQLNDPHGLGARPLIVATLLDRGPEILFRTHHSVVSSPYHRNAAGIWDTYRLFASPDEAEGRAIVARRGIGLLLLCPTGAERTFFEQKKDRGNLYNRLLDGEPPPWLVSVPVGAPDTDFRLFRVVRP